VFCSRAVCDLPAQPLAISERTKPTQAQVRTCTKMMVPDVVICFDSANIFNQILCLAAGVKTHGLRTLNRWVTNPSTCDKTCSGLYRAQLL